MYHSRLRLVSSRRFCLALSLCAIVCCQRAWAQPLERGQIVYKVSSGNQKLEMTVNSSRMLTLEQQVPRVQVNNKELVDVTPLSPNEINIFAKKAGITQINLWTDDNRIHTIDVIVKGDAQELSGTLKEQFPHASIRVNPTSGSVILSGYVDRVDDVNQIVEISKEYYPKVINNMRVGGVQQVLLRTKVWEVSRTKLRAIGSDFATASGQRFAVSSVSGLINAASASAGSAAGVGGDTLRFGFVDGNTQFFAFMEFLQKNELVKVLAEPNLTALSGRPAYVTVGGQIPILVPQSLGTVSIDYKEYGTRVDFVPIVLGNGNIHLDVRPSVSELDDSRSVTINGTSVPGLRNRAVDTGVEMKPGQTLALAGLVQSRTDTTKTGVPYLMDMPYIGTPFRRTRETTNEVELLVLVTPELVEAMNPEEVPACGPGMHSQSPTDCDLYWKGLIEKPACGPCGDAVRAGSCGECSSCGGEVGPDGMTVKTSNMTGPKAGAAEVTNKNRNSKDATPTSATPGSVRQGNNVPNTAGDRQASTYRSQTATTVAANGSQTVRQNPTNSQDPRSSQANRAPGGVPGLIGPVGYDVVK